MNSKSGIALFLAALAAATAAVCWLMLASEIPLGVMGEWVWNRSTPPPLQRWALPALAGVVLVLVGAAGYRSLVKSGRGSLAWLVALMAAGAFHQAALVDLPGDVFGMERWPFALALKNTSGYHAIAAERHAAGVTVPRFLREYAAWIETQDSFHVGTHPPGLFVANLALIEFFANRLELVDQLQRHSPKRWASGVAAYETQIGRLEPPARAALAAVAALTWLAVWLAALAVYLLVRAGSTPAVAYLAAALWLAAPGPLLFLPLADSFFVLPAAAGLACFRWGLRSAWLAVPLGALFGALQWMGMHCSLAFAVVGAAAAILGVLTLVAAPRHELMRQLFRLLLVSIAAFAAFGALVWWNYREHGLPLWHVWLINLRKHAGFYAAMPRSYWPWIGVNLLEFLVVLGPGAAVAWIFAAPAAARDWRSRTLFWTAVLLVVALDLSGKNLSEAGRLWLFLLPLAVA
ncbi:MAG TPA: hypothetical protein VNC50_06170, partial [Planctomycetia bacterium]|nr:hypothetical protein [Planctomycetia bacterium]